MTRDLDGKIFWTFFWEDLPLWTKMSQNFSHPDITIHTPIESPCRVDKKYAVSKFFLSDFWPKKPKNSVKIGNFKVRFKKSCF
jgi:hypothetical protein